MLLVIFGAGASYDSDPDHRPVFPLDARADSLPTIEQYRPPLANRLFDNRQLFLAAMGLFPECQPLIPRLRRPGIAVEQELATMQEESDRYVERHKQLAAIRYYIRRAILDCQNQWRTVHQGITNYAAFLDEIDRWRAERNEQVCFVTFNYDTMLEEAMGPVLRLQVKDMESYYSWQNYSLFKLHGSVDWGRVVDGFSSENAQPSRFYQHLIDNVRPDTPAVTGRYQLCAPDMRPVPDNGVVLYPALSIPVAKKDEFSCPPAHVAALEGKLPMVTKMITIGWRATEAEFLAKIQLSRAVRTAGVRPVLSLLVVSGSKQGAEETLKNVTPYRGAYDPYIKIDREVSTGFSGLITEDVATLRDFLRMGAQ